MTNNHLDDYSIFSRTYATYFNGTSASGNYLTTPSNPVFSFGLGDFTLEAWIWYFPLVGNTFGKMILDGRPAATNGPYVNFGLDNTGKIGISLGSNYYASSSALATRTWIHVAATRRNGTVRVFVNGAIVATGTGNTDAITSGGYYIGQNAFMANDTYFNGYISNARIVRGLAVYTDTFTPPTSPLTNIRGLGYDTSLLALQSSSPTVENSSNALTLTAFNGPLTTTNIPTRFYNGFFNGTNQYMTVPSDAAFSFGTGDFTVECWLWTPAFTNTYGRVIVDARPTGTNGVYWNFGLGTDGKPGLNLTNGGTVYTSSVSVADSKWHHVAVTRQSGTIRMFVDGVSVLTPVSGAETTGSGGLRIGFNSFGTVGGFAAETLWNGHLSNLRIVKGTAVYTAGFTPPTRQLTAIAGTSLLALQTATVTKDNSINNFTITNINSTTAIAPISWPTVQKQYTTGVTEVAGLLDDYTKTGAVSSYFIGDGYYLSTPSNASFSFGTGDFTLEAWVYPINGGRAADALKYGTIISQFLAGSTGAGSNSWGLGIGMNGGVFSSITLEADGGSRLNITGLTFALKTWYHVAVVRNSGTLTAYVNGTSVGSSSYASAINNNSSGSVQIGRSAYATSYNNWLNGYLSNVRVTKGIAVYTGAFTPSTMPLQTTQPAGTNIAAITSASSVSLLTCQDLGLTDKSLNGFTLTNTGGVTTTIKQIPF
jgi:hypothetical protein